MNFAKMSTEELNALDSTNLSIEQKEELLSVLQIHNQILDMEIEILDLDEKILDIQDEILNSKAKLDSLKNKSN